jgi:hypothetical protein
MSDLDKKSKCAKSKCAKSKGAKRKGAKRSSAKASKGGDLVKLGDFFDDFSKDTDVVGGERVIYKPNDILGAIEFIVENAENSALSADFFESIAGCTDYLTERLSFTTIQCVMLSALIEVSDSTPVGLRQLSRFFGCSKARMLHYSSEIDGLAERGYLSTQNSLSGCSFDDLDSDGGGSSYYVPEAVISTLKKNQPYVPEDPTVADCYSLFDAFDRLYSLRKNNSIGDVVLVREIRRLLSSNKKLDFVAHITSYNLSDSDLVLLIYFCRLYVNNRDDEIGSHDVRDAFDIRNFRQVWSALVDGCSELTNLGYVENAMSNGMAEHGFFKLTETTKRELLSEMNISEMQARTNNTIIACSDLTPKKLFYNDVEARQVTELTDLLGVDKFVKVQENLQKKGLRKGFACLFYGAPGTGKTETVNQIAIMTGRDLMPVNVTDIEDKYVGESEKNMRAVFERYRCAAKRMDKAPILLFNEADAVIGKRLNVQNEVAKMENSVQNIILEEMEKLDGIMIATTNLTGNIDLAFDRRFIYKIEFTKPMLAVRVSIWKSMIPELTEEQAQQAALKFDLTGGQIENVARKIAVANVLSGSDVIDTEELFGYCMAEKSVFRTAANRRVGF